MIIVTLNRTRFFWQGKTQRNKLTKEMIWLLFEM